MTTQTKEANMFVVESESHLDESITSGVIVIEHRSTDGTVAYSDATGLRGPDCRRLAQAYAAQLGLAQPGISGSVETYPVDEHGREVSDPKTQKVVAFRASVPVTRKLF